MDRINIIPRGIEKLVHEQALADELEPAAKKIMSRARAKTPSWVDAYFFTWADVGPNGAYAQAIGRGSGIVLAEYGGRRSPAHAMFRSSV